MEDERHWYWIDDYDKAIQILEKIPKQSVMINGNRMKLTNYQRDILFISNITLIKILDYLW